METERREKVEKTYDKDNRYVTLMLCPLRDETQVKEDDKEINIEAVYDAIQNMSSKVVILTLDEVLETVRDTHCKFHMQQQYTNKLRQRECCPKILHYMKN